MGLGLSASVLAGESQRNLDGQIASSEGNFHDETGLYMAGQSVGHGNFYFLNYGHLFGPEVFLSLCDDLYEYSYFHIFSFDHYD